MVIRNAQNWHLLTSDGLCAPLLYSPMGERMRQGIIMIANMIPHIERAQRGPTWKYPTGLRCPTINPGDERQSNFPIDDKQNSRLDDNDN